MYAQENGVNNEINGANNAANINGVLANCQALSLICII